MDPLTAALLLVGELAKNWGMVMQSATPEQRQQIAQMQIDDMKAWREFLAPMVKFFTHKEGETHVRSGGEGGTGAHQTGD